MTYWKREPSIAKRRNTAISIKSLTRNPRVGNLRWSKPWECVRLIPDGGSVNKIGLTNKGVEWWCAKVGPHLNFERFPLVGSIFGETSSELEEMAIMLDRFDLVGLEVNVSCPNSGHPDKKVEMVVESVKAVKELTRHPIIIKVGVDQDYLAIARGLEGVAEAISINSVPWKMVFPKNRSPLWRLEQRVGGGGGGVSGKPAQDFNWAAVEALAKQGSLPVIAPSIMEFEDLETVTRYGAKAYSFGAIHLRTPWKPTSIVERDMKCR